MPKHQWERTPGYLAEVLKHGFEPRRKCEL